MTLIRNLTSARNRYKTLLTVVIILMILVYVLYTNIYLRKQSEDIDKIKSLLEDDLQRGGNKVVAAFQKKNSGKKDGLTLVETEHLEIRSGSSRTETEEIFFRYLETKDVLCGNDVRLGNQHDGGWNVCMSPPFNLTKPCLIYSFGIGGDWRFEDDLYDFYGCRVLAFDPSMGMKQHNRTELMSFQPIGLGAKMETTSEGWKLRTFRTILSKAGHLKTVIDYLKFDIDYYEWDVLKSLTRDNILRYVKQIAFEIHLLKPPINEYTDRALRKQELIDKLGILQGLEQVGFKKFNFRMNPFCLYTSGITGKLRSKCYDLHYLNMDFIQTKHIEKTKEIR